MIPTARLQASRLIVVLLGGRQFRMTENVYNAANMRRILGCNGGRDAMAEEMHPKMLSKGCGGVLRDAIGDRSPVQWSSDPRNPEGIAFPRPSAPPLE